MQQALAALQRENERAREESSDLRARLSRLENAGADDAAAAAEADSREYVRYAKANPYGKEVEGQDEPTLDIGDGYGDRAWDACEARSKHMCSAPRLSGL
eukprot:COSAG05_NODE_1008_length_6213_cov_13.207720_3_plen_100_part_00